jgi:hypothetical protein
MASAKRSIRHLIDSFSEDLILIAKGVVKEHVERTLAEWQAKNQRLSLRKPVESDKAARNRKALERIERVALRRREREEKKATERALRLEQRLVEGKKPRVRRSSLSEPTEKNVPAPPPLFVHKRRRDGEIEQLKRTDETEADGSSALNAGVLPLPALAAT